MKKPSSLAVYLSNKYPILSPKSAQYIALIANRTAREYGTTWATNIVFQDIPAPKVIEYDGYHAESRTGIRASMAALKRFWHTYHYVPMHCTVALPLLTVSQLNVATV